jgi:CubicO group peptidase (beta-lactamase class C family)
MVRWLVTTALLLFSPASLLAQTVPRYAGPPTEVFLKRWLLLGPIPLTDKPSPSGDIKMEEEAQRKLFDSDMLASCGGETQAFGTNPPTCTIAGRDLTWKAVESADDVVDLNKALGPTDYAAAYALAEIESRSAASVLMALGSDDAVKVWLNGKLVHRHWVARALSKDQDLALLPLQPGRNLLLLKVTNERLAWSFCLRFLGGRGLEKVLWQAANDGDLEKMEMLLGGSGKFRINAKVKHGLSAWQIANLLGRTDAAALLVKHGASTTLAMPKLESVIDSILSEGTAGKRPGIAVLVMRDGKVLFEKGYGYASLEHDVRVTPDTKFPVASITKQFTASAILRLQEQGKLSVTDPLAKYFPDFPKGKQITLHQLLTHTSGIHNFALRPDYEISAASPIDFDELLEIMRKEPFDFEPGSRFSYSNSGYLLLGEIVAKVSGKSFAEFLKTEFFEPLGMKDTSVHAPDVIAPHQVRAFAILPHQATGYGFRDNVTKRMTSWDATSFGGAGALISTVRDLGRWNQALLAGKVLSEASLKVAWTPVNVAVPKGTPPDSPLNQRGYGYGWLVSKVRGLLEIQHSGALPGFVGNVQIFPSERFVVAVEDNAWGSLPGLHPYLLAGKIAQFYLGSKMQPQPNRKLASLSEQSLDGLLGRYDLAGEQVTVTREGSHIFARVSLGPKVEIFPLSDTEFFWKDTGDPIAFTRDEKGRASRMGMRQGWMAWYQAPRIEEPAVVQVAPEVLESYVGRYDFGQGRAILTVSREGNRLYAQMKGQAKEEILPRSQTTFFSKLVPGEVTFVNDTRGKVTGLIHEQGARKLEIRRVE